MRWLAPDDDPRATCGARGPREEQRRLDGDVPRERTSTPIVERSAHVKIVTVLRAMSFGKCFYCEQTLGEREHEVDHYIKLAEDPTRAFAWTNLYLACRLCNDKLTNLVKPVAQCLDPCDPAARPGDHLTFENDVIRARDGSATGYNTIQKYALHRDDLNLKRSRQLRLFDAALHRIHRRMIAEQRATMLDVEEAILRRFAQRDHAFSLMFAAKLEAEGL